MMVAAIAAGASRCEEGLMSGHVTVGGGQQACDGIVPDDLVRQILEEETSRLNFQAASNGEEADREIGALTRLRGTRALFGRPRCLAIRSLPRPNDFPSR